MKPFFLLVGLFCGLLSTAPAQSTTGFFRAFPLDDRTPYVLPIAVSKGMTTLLFPIAPSNYMATRIVFLEPGQGNADYSGDDRVDFVCLAHKGSNFCSIRAMRPGVQDTLSVMLDGRVYQLFLRAEEQKPLYTVQFVKDRNGGGGGGRSIRVTPERLVGCLNEAKAYAVLSKYYPDRLSNITYVRPARIITYTDFRVLIDEVFRFENEDTLVFRVLLENQTDREIIYDPKRLAIRVEPQGPGIVGGAPLFDASIVDAEGLIPPHAIVPAYFAITGTPEGGRNDLDPARNKFTVLVPRIFDEEPAPLPTPVPEPDFKKEETPSKHPSASSNKGAVQLGKAS